MTTPDASAPSTPDPVAQLLGNDRPPRGWRRPFWWVLALVLLVLSVNIFGDWLRDALNPRLK